MFSADSGLSESDKLVFLLGTYSISSQSLIHLLTTVIFDSSVSLVFLSILFNYNCWLDRFSASQLLLFFDCFKNLKLSSPKCIIWGGMCNLLTITKANIFTLIVIDAVWISLLMSHSMWDITFIMLINIKPELKFLKEKNRINSLSFQWAFSYVNSWNLFSVMQSVIVSIFKQDLHLNSVPYFPVRNHIRSMELHKWK